jgi:hypothetical protein
LAAGHSITGLGKVTRPWLLDVWHVNVNINTARLSLCSALGSLDHLSLAETSTVYILYPQPSLLAVDAFILTVHTSHFGNFPRIIKLQ